MKLTAIFLFAACLHVTAKSYAQITLSETNVSLQKVFKKIQQQSAYDFVCTYDIFQKAGNVTVEVHDVSLQKAMEECLKGKQLTYLIINKTIVVKRAEVFFHNASTTVLSPLPPPPPPVEIHGRVVKTTGEPLQNVSVLIAGSKIGTTTDNNGYFTLTVSDNRNVVLEISSVGFETQKVKVGKQTELNIILEEAQTGLNEVVNWIWYQEQKGPHRLRCPG